MESGRKAVCLERAKSNVSDSVDGRYPT
jgi:hypothetical protein